MRLIPRIFVQSFAILAVSGALALGVNIVRPDGPAPVLAATSVVQPGKSAEIGIKDAAMLFLSHRAVFLDARSPFEYAMGHVQGAISLPVVEFASRYQDIKPQLAGKTVITYCDGDLCPLSHRLAKHLREAGVRDVYVLVNGWSLWRQEKLPVAKGNAASGKSSASAKGGICRDCEN